VDPRQPMQPSHVPVQVLLIMWGAFYRIPALLMVPQLYSIVVCDASVLLLVSFYPVEPAISISLSVIVETFATKNVMAEEIVNQLVPRLVRGVLHHWFRLPPTELPAHLQGRWTSTTWKKISGVSTRHMSLSCSVISLRW
jgi:hypothetical protein